MLPTSAYYAFLDIYMVMLPGYYSQLRDTDNEFKYFIQMPFYLWT